MRFGAMNRELMDIRCSLLLNPPSGESMGGIELARTMCFTKAEFL